MKLKKLPPILHESIVVFVGLRVDHHRVLCIKKVRGSQESLWLPNAPLPRNAQAEAVALDIRNTYIEDELAFRRTFTAYAPMRLSHGKGTIDVWACAEFVDERCRVKNPHTAIWIPFEQLLDDDQSAETWTALLALEHKHHLI
ncbi:MAG: hypothetical protein WC763_04005 [Candidatus Paceibacterota bacterium]|jgi:hypothetical protein